MDKEIWLHTHSAQSTGDTKPKNSKTQRNSKGTGRSHIKLEAVDQRFS